MTRAVKRLVGLNLIYVCNINCLYKCFSVIYPPALLVIAGETTVRRLRWADLHWEKIIFNKND